MALENGNNGYVPTGRKEKETLKRPFFLVYDFVEKKKSLGVASKIRAFLGVK